jgi:hypothetical protein
MATLLRIIRAGAIAVIMTAILWVVLPWVSEDFLSFRTGGMPRLFTSTHDGFSVTFAYPFFGRSGVDADIAQLRERFIEEVSQVQEQSAGGDEQIEATSLTVTYRVVHRTWRSVSILFSASITISEVHMQGLEKHVHEGASFFFAKTYDLLEERPLSLIEMTGGNTDALRILVLQVIERLGAHPEVDIRRAEQNVRPVPEFLEQVVRGDGFIMVYLNPGQVAPREVGIIEVVVPLEVFTQ